MAGLAALIRHTLMFAQGRLPVRALIISSGLLFVARFAGLRPHVLRGIDRRFLSGTLLVFLLTAALIAGLGLCGVALIIIALLFRGSGTKNNQRQNRKEHSQPCNIGLS